MQAGRADRSRSGRQRLGPGPRRGGGPAVGLAGHGHRLDRRGQLDGRSPRRARPGTRRLSPRGVARRPRTARRQRPHRVRDEACVHRRRRGSTRDLAGLGAQNQRRVGRNLRRPGHVRRNPRRRRRLLASVRGRKGAGEAQGGGIRGASPRRAVAARRAHRRMGVAGEELARWPQRRRPGGLPGQSGQIGDLGPHATHRSSAMIDA